MINCNTLTHTYDTSTCVSDYKDENPDDNDFYFKLDFKLFSKGLYNSEDDESECEERMQNGGGTTKWINVSLKPSAAINVEDIVCEDSPIIISDISTEGLYGFGPECSTEYNSIWEILAPGDTLWTTIDREYVKDENGDDTDEELPGSFFLWLDRRC